jgi:tripartite-type tricarboxylate transporter receptor subunit TctC
MIRYFVSFPVGAHVRPEQIQMLAEHLNKAADDREWRDIVVNEGATITDMRARVRPVSALVRRARARVR